MTECHECQYRKDCLSLWRLIQWLSCRKGVCKQGRKMKQFREKQTTLPLPSEDIE